MKKPLLILAVGLGATGAFAQEIVGQVVSATPVVQQVQVPRQVCQQAMVPGEPQTTGAGGLVGAITGAAIGSQIGGGSGTAAAMMLGAVGGALLGNHAEAQGARDRAQLASHCTTQYTLENRTVGYNVTYEYGGSQYTVQMPHDPGPTVRLQVSPVGSSPAMPAPQAAAPLGARPGPVVVAPPIQHEGTYAPQAISSAPPVVVTEPVVVTQPVYPIVYAAPVYRPYYPPVGISLNFGYSRGGHYHHRRHRHWR